MKAFLSYRSADTESFTDDLYTFLTKELQVHSVKGGESIPAGDDWRRRIVFEIGTSDVFVPIIGQKWELGNGDRNILNKKDVVRFEVEQAIKRRIPIIPLLIDREKLDKSRLPPKLHVLDKRQHKFANMKFEKEGLPSFIAKLREIAEEIRPKPVVLLSSTLAFLGDKESTEGLDYFMTLVMSVIQGLKGHREVIPKIPPYAGRNAVATVSQNQTEMLQEIVDNLSRYSGLIIAPFETEPLRDELLKLLRRDPKFPVATIDKAYPSDDPFFVAAKLRPPVGSVGDGVHNGGLAAKSIIKYFRQARISDPNVVVLQGLEGSHERVVGFIGEVNEHNSDPSQGFRIHLSVSKETEFLDNKAAERARSYMRPQSDWPSFGDSKYMAMIKNNVPRGHESVDAFFCCNDEMALGVWELLDRNRINTGQVEPTVVVGYDGIAAVRRKISNKDPWFLNSVDVRMTEQIRRLVEAFTRALRNRAQVSAIEPVEGIMVGIDQSDHVAAIIAQRKAGGSVLQLTTAELSASGSAT